MVTLSLLFDETFTTFSMQIGIDILNAHDPPLTIEEGDSYIAMVRQKDFPKITRTGALIVESKNY